MKWNYIHQPKEQPFWEFATHQRRIVFGRKCSKAQLWELIKLEKIPVDYSVYQHWGTPARGSCNTNLL